MESRSLSEASKTLVDTNLKSPQYNPEQKQLQNGPNFVTLSQISEEEKLDISKRDFQLNQEGKISLKKYSQGTDE